MLCGLETTAGGTTFWPELPSSMADAAALRELRQGTSRWDPDLQYSTLFVVHTYMQLIHLAFVHTPLAVRSEGSQSVHRDYFRA